MKNNNDSNFETTPIKSDTAPFIVKVTLDVTNSATGETTQHSLEASLVTITARLTDDKHMFCTSLGAARPFDIVDTIMSIEELKEHLVSKVPDFDKVVMMRALHAALADDKEIKIEKPEDMPEAFGNMTTAINNIFGVEDEKTGNK